MNLIGLLKRRNNEDEEKKFSAEFKAKTLELAGSLGSMKKSAEALGIGVPSLYDWKKLAGSGGSKKADKGLIEQLQNENK